MRSLPVRLAGCATMDADEPLTRAQGEALLEYAQATYLAVTTWRRRMATVALALAILVGLMFAFTATRWLSTRGEIASVADDALIDVVGVEIPDPRPPLERAQLRVAAMLWGFATAITGVMTLMFVALYLLARPPDPPQPPM